MNKPEWILIVIGCIAASITGAREPAYCIIQTKIAIVSNRVIFNFRINVLFINRFLKNVTKLCKSKEYFYILFFILFLEL